MSGEHLWSAISEASPCGPDLWDDLGFEIETEAREAGGRMVEGELRDSDGDRGQGPSWPKVERLAKDGFARCKDVRLAVYWTKARVWRDGMLGLAQGLTLFRELFERYPEALHPQPEGDDGSPLIYRFNQFVNLFDDQMIRGLLHSEFTRTPQSQFRFSLRQVLIARGIEEARDGEDAPSSSDVDAAFGLWEEESLNEFHQGCQTAREELDRVIALADAWPDADGIHTYPPGSARLRRLVQEATDQVGAAVQRRTASEQEDNGETEQQDMQAVDTDGEGEGAQQSQSEPKVAAVSVPGTIRSAGDVLESLDRICDYYQHNEPSSPIPLLLRRAQRLVGKSFLEALEELAPDGLNAARGAGGIRND